MRGRRVGATVDVLEGVQGQLLRVGQVGNVQRHLQLHEKHVNVDRARLAIRIKSFVAYGQIKSNGVRLLRAGRDGGHVEDLALAQDDVGDHTLDVEIHDLDRHKVLVGDVDEICDLHIDGVRVEVDHDRQHGHGRQGDAPGEEEEEDETAETDTRGHGGAHVQLRASRFQSDIVTRYHSYELICLTSGNPPGSPTRGAGVASRVSTHGSVRRKVLQRARLLHPVRQIGAVMSW